MPWIVENMLNQQGKYQENSNADLMSQHKPLSRITVSGFGGTYHNNIPFLSINFD